MKKIITLIAITLIAFTANAENKPQKFQDGIYQKIERTATTYKATEVGLTVGVLGGMPFEYVGEDMDGMVINANAVFKNLYIGIGLGNEIFLPKAGYAFRVKFFDTDKQYDAVVAPYAGALIMEDLSALNYGVYTVFKLSDGFGLSLDLNIAYAAIGFSIAF